jgi:hypothetical protein
MCDLPGGILLRVRLMFRCSTVGLYNTSNGARCRSTLLPLHTEIRQSDTIQSIQQSAKPVTKTAVMEELLWEALKMRCARKTWGGGVEENLLNSAESRAYANIYSAAPSALSSQPYNKTTVDMPACQTECNLCGKPDTGVD